MIFNVDEPEIDLDGFVAQLVQNVDDSDEEPMEEPMFVVDDTDVEDDDDDVILA